MEKDEEIKSLESKVEIQQKNLTKLQTDLVLGKYKNYTTQGMFIGSTLKVIRVAIPPSFKFCRSLENTELYSNVSGQCLQNEQKH